MIELLGVIAFILLARLVWDISAQLTKYVVVKIWPHQGITIHRGYAGKRCFEYIRNDKGRLVWVNRLPEHDVEGSDDERLH